jgi:transcriptional regulator with XRE-family HTH domain
MSADVSFGEWLKRRRQGLGLTQQQLAAQINCATITFSPNGKLIDRHSQY